jgi:hypothetical protein
MRRLVWNMCSTFEEGLYVNGKMKPIESIPGMGERG